MTVEEPFVETDKRDVVLSNISAMSDEDKSRYGFVWLAELTDGSSICQFDGRGEEQNYSKVRQELSNGNVEGLYFVPVEAGLSTYGVKPDNVEGETGLLRRGFRQVKRNGVTASGYVPRIKAGGKYLYIHGDNALVSQDQDLNVVEEFGLGA